jgi:hypothetical protein
MVWTPVLQQQEAQKAAMPKMQKQYSFNFKKPCLTLALFPIFKQMSNFAPTTAELKFQLCIKKNSSTW